MRTKSCGTISTASSCSIDLPVGHGPPVLPLIPPLPSTTPQVCTCHLISQSQEPASTNQLPAACWSRLLEGLEEMLQSAKTAPCSSSSSLSGMQATFGPCSLCFCPPGCRYNSERLPRLSFRVRCISRHEHSFTWGRCGVPVISTDQD